MIGIKISPIGNSSPLTIDTFGSGPDLDGRTWSPTSRPLDESRLDRNGLEFGKF